MLPSKEVCELLGLKPSEEDGVYLQSEEVAAFDQVMRGQARGLAVDKSKLQKALADNGLELFWVVIGEKLILGGMGNFAGRLEMGGVHWLKSDGKIDSHTYSKYLPPEKPKKQSKTKTTETPAFD